jgi:hypothetical protein
VKESKRDLLVAAYHALRSYQFGNSSPDLAQSIADKIELEIWKDPGPLSKTLSGKQLS